MSREFFASTNFRAKTLSTIEQANEILDEYAVQGFTLTLRQLFYQFVARGLIPNTVQDYKRLGRAISDARRAGLVDWDHIEDRTREIETFSAWDSPAGILLSAAQSYREDLWQDQSHRPEVWIEKAALIGVIAPVCGRWRVPHMAARGYPSHSELYVAGKRLQAISSEGQTPIVFYLGDHDPSGLDMTRSLRDELTLYGRSPVEVIRLGLNLSQVWGLDLPPNPAKEYDARYSKYVEETEQTSSWELDALSPTFIDGLLEDAVGNLVDRTAWAAALESETANRGLLRQTARRFDSTTSANPQEDGQ